MSVLADLAASKVSRDYTIGERIGIVGPQGVWTLYAATAKRAGAAHKRVTVWVLDKARWQPRALPAAAVRSGGYHRSDDAAPDTPGGADSVGIECEHLFYLQRQGAKALARLKHPRIVSLLEPLEETSGQLLLVTEPLAGTLAQMLAPDPASHSPPTVASPAIAGAPPAGDLLGSCGAAPASGGRLSAVELQFGLLQVSEAVAFLHEQAQVAHCGLSAHAVVIAADGSFKLAGKRALQ